MWLGRLGSEGGPAAFVAKKTLSRFPVFANQVPMYASVRPCVSALGGTGYISAVSMKSTPRSRAYDNCSCASASVFCSPQVMVPSAIALTVSPVRPKGLRSMGGTVLWVKVWG